jgi:lysophospholipase L1-like esterase
VQGAQGDPGPVGAAAPGLPRLRYLLFGDSISETAVVLDDGTYTADVFENWPADFAQLVDPAAMVNYSKSSATFRDRAAPTPWQLVSYQVAKAVEHGIAADIVIVAAGTNDSVSSLGSYTTAMGKATLDDLDRTLLYESLRWNFWRIRAAWPDATCFAVLPIQRADVPPEAQETVNDAIRSMARRYNVLVIDAAHESGIISDLEVKIGPGHHLRDGLHPNATGRMALARLVARYVRTATLY